MWNVTLPLVCTRMDPYMLVTWNFKEKTEQEAQKLTRAI